MADLAGRPVVAEVHLAVDGDHAADARSERQPDQRLGTPPSPQPELGQAEGSRVVDERDGQAERGLDRIADGDAGPVPRHVHEEASRSGRGVIEPRHADADRRDVRAPLDGSACDLDCPADDRVGALVGEGRNLSAVQRLPGVGPPFERRPLEIRDAEVDSEVVGQLRRGHVSPITRV